MLKILAYKKFNTSVLINNKLTVATVCQLDKMSVLHYSFENDHHNFVIGFFTVEKPDKLNKSILNGMYQKDREIKKNKFKISRIQNDKYETRLVDFLKEKFNSKTEFDIVDLNEYFNTCTVTGFIKGRGFAGPMKRHDFSGLNATHGVSLKHRAHGSTGSRKPNHTIKGQRMGGHFYGKSTVKNIKICKNKELGENVLVLLGTVPGAPNSLLELRFKDLIQQG